MAESVPKILVVDDNEANRALAESTLEDEGYSVVLARGGIEGVALFERERPDCVLLDIRMPDLDGFAVCAKMRAVPEIGAETPILFLTASRDVDTFDEALKAGGDDFLMKPVRPTELVVRIQTALKLRRLGAELRGHYDLLKQQRDDMLRLQLQKERLMAFVVHDLKNPVNTMDLHAQLLLREKDLPPRVRDGVMHIRHQTQQLTRMILNLLDVSRADEGRLTLERAEVDVGALVRDLVNDLAVTAEAHGVTLQVDVAPIRIELDEDLVRRTLTNLVENAIRYAPRESAVVVVGAVRPGALELRISDAGRGIPVAMREQVFQPFVQIERGASSSVGNRGLGLAFCKLAVEAHGGTITIEDASPGTTFCVTLPS